jgi:hypothetical protein
MIEMTQDEALHLAGELAGRALKETEARCGVLAQFINDCSRTRSGPAASTGALRELGALHARRALLIRRRALIQEALDCTVGDSPARAPLARPIDGPPPRVQKQVQLQVQARRRRP